MKTGMFASAVLVIALLVAAPASGQSRMKVCGDEWQTMKKANQTAGKTWAAFRKECMSRGGALAREAGGSDMKAAGKPERKPRAKSSGGRAAMQVRQRACAAEWKADKAAGKVEKGMSWPKYWSACNTRKKSAA